VKRGKADLSMKEGDVLTKFHDQNRAKEDNKMLRQKDNSWGKGFITYSVWVSIIVMVIIPVKVVAQDQVSNEALRKDIQKLLILTGSDQVAIQIMNQMITMFKQSSPQVPEEFWQEFMKEAEANVADLNNLVIPIYAKYLSHEEIKELIRFYETPVGQKILKVLPQIMQESMVAGQQWGQQLGEKAVTKLKEKGYK
jgi:hypothetical protein